MIKQRKKTLFRMNSKRGYWIIILMLTNIGCADGITAGVLVPYEAFCYQIVSESVPRQTASERCTSGGGTLAVLPTNASLTTVGNKVKTESESGVISSSVFWLGMNNTRGRILSDNGQDVTIPISSIQSQSELPRGACVLLSLSTGEPTLTSADCTRTFWMYGYICQYANSSSCRIELSFLTLLVLLVVWIQ
eukprot:XP_019923703.1 PREDICTED: uncharacterized protein LOC105330426 [Crassostrea gigas]